MPQRQLLAASYLSLYTVQRTLGTALGDESGPPLGLALGSALDDSLVRYLVTSSVHQWVLSLDYCLARCSDVGGNVKVEVLLAAVHNYLNSALVYDLACWALFSIANGSKRDELQYCRRGKSRKGRLHTALPAVPHGFLC
jgi:hypothetical protein